MTEYEACQLYLALKSHFISNTYDFFKYNGKVRLTESSFNGRKDKYQFTKLVKKVSEDQMKDYILFNLIHNEKLWIGNLFDSESRDIWQKHRKYKESITYSFSSELDILFDKIHINNLFKATDEHTLPEILNMLISNTITWETFCILDHYIKFSTNFDNILKNNSIWKIYSNKLKKISPFFTEYYTDKTKKILKDKINERNNDYGNS